MVPEDVKSFIMKNKVVAFMGTILLVFILLFALTFILPMSKSSISQNLGGASYDMGMSRESLDFDSKGLSDSLKAPNTVYSSGSYVEVKEGSMSIETKNAEQDASEIRSLTESFGGYVEDERKYDNVYNTNINIRSRIPDDKFQGFVDTLKN
ncbi:MAG: DUF4349 domain-containing protein, partial [Candidatus Aenigmarchaeota archaeon]|nr:DUF4349 domain-containing protein [Candidatus Aenigmarchaeota archaeon]